MFLFRTNLEVEEKYDEYIDSNSSKNSEDAINWLQFYIGEMNDFVDVGFHEVRKDKVEYVKASFLSVFQSIISGITNPLAIKAEIEVIEVQIKLAQTFCLLEEELLDNINDITGEGFAPSPVLIRTIHSRNPFASTPPLSSFDPHARTGRDCSPPSRNKNHHSANLIHLTSDRSSNHMR